MPLVVWSQHVRFHKAGKALPRDLSVNVCVCVCAWFVSCKSTGKSFCSKNTTLRVGHTSSINKESLFFAAIHLYPLLQSLQIYQHIRKTRGLASPYTRAYTRIHTRANAHTHIACFNHSSHACVLSHVLLVTSVQVILDL